jgi:hypothetical protein
VCGDVLDVRKDRREVKLEERLLIPGLEDRSCWNSTS